MIRRWRRWLVLVLVLACALLGVHSYLASHWVAARVAAKLSELYGGVVQVGGARVGTNETVLFDVALFEPGDTAKPWLTIDRLEADLSLRDALSGASPSRVALKGLTVTLRFDDEGVLLTRLPHRANSASPMTTVPLVSVDAGKLLMVGPGSRRLNIDDLNATLTPAADLCTIAGRATCANCADWKADGSLDIGKLQLSLTARSGSDVSVSQSSLQALPFVPPNTWDEIQADGASSVVVTLNFDWNKSERTFLVELQPSKANIHVAAIDLAATDVAGGVDITDGKVVLRNLQGRACDGKLDVDGDLDFTQPGTIINLTKIVIDDADVRRLPASWSLPPQLEGRLNGDINLNLVVADGKLKTKGAGAGEIRQARIAGQAATGPIQLTLQELDGASHLRVDLKFPPCELSNVVGAFGADLPAQTSGKVALDASLYLPLDTICDIRSHHASGRLDLTDLRVAGLNLEPLSTKVRYVATKLKLDETRAQLKSGGSILVGAEVGLKEPYAFSVRLEPTGINLATLDQLDASIRPSLSATGSLQAVVDVEGTMRPCAVASTGNATLQNVRSAGCTIQTAKLHWRSDTECAVVDTLQADGYGGKITGQALLPFTTRGVGSIQLALSGLDLSQAGPLGSVKIAGRISGKIRADFAPPVNGQPRDISVDADLASPEFTVEKIPTNQVAAKLQLRKGSLSYRMDGQLFGGSFGVEGEEALGKPASPGQQNGGRLWCSGLDLARLAGMPDAGTLGGTADAELAFSLDGEDDFPLAKGRVAIADVVWKDQPLAPQLLGDVVLSRQELTVGNIMATIARGNLGGKIVVNFKQPERSWCQLDLGNAELSEFLRPWPALAEHAEGTMDLRVRSMLGKEWAGTADIVLQRGKVLGVDVSEWRVPISLSLNPAEGRGELVVRDSNAQVANGRVTAQATATWNSGMRLGGQIQFQGVDVRQAFPGTKVGNGRATGRLDFSSEHLTTVDDLQATLVTTMQHTQALDYPVLRQVAPFLGLTTTKTFQTGEIRARLARSVVHIEKLTMAAGPVQLFAQGNASLHGNIHLDMTANTGRLGNLAALLGWQLPQTGPLGGDLLARATAALSPQLIHVHVRGTVREPTVQVVPLPLLTEQALRFFTGN